MKVLLLYRAHSESERAARHYTGNFERQTGKQLSVLEADSPEGGELARLYDIVQYPAIIVRTDEGALQQLWQGEPLPRFGEVAYYVEEQGRGLLGHTKKNI